MNAEDISCEIVKPGNPFIVHQGERCIVTAESVRTETPKVSAVKAANAFRGRDPHKAFPVLQNVVHGHGRQAIHIGKMQEGWFLSL